MPQRPRRRFTCQWLIAFHQHLANLLEHRLRRKIPILVELCQQQRQIILRQLGRRSREPGVPILRLGRPRIQRRQRHHRKLRRPERRIEPLVDRIALPTSLLPLRRQHCFHRQRQMLIALRTAPRLGHAPAPRYRKQNPPSWPSCQTDKATHPAEFRTHTAD